MHSRISQRFTSRSFLNMFVLCGWRYSPATWHPFPSLKRDLRVRGMSNQLLFGAFYAIPFGTSDTARKSIVAVDTSFKCLWSRPIIKALKNPLCRVAVHDCLARSPSHREGRGLYALPVLQKAPFDLRFRTPGKKQTWIGNGLNSRFLCVLKV